MSSWRKFLKLSWAERSLLAQALIMLPLAAVALKLVGLRRCQIFLAARLQRGGAPQDLSRAALDEKSSTIIRLVRAAAWRGPYRANCLQQSLVLWWLLRRAGIVADLHIGVRKNGNDLEAHAWVENAGRVLNDTDDVAERFHRFDEAIIPAEARIR